VTELAGKTCVVTGAASGIGRATAVALAERGARLVLTDRDADGLENVARATGAAHAAPVDVTDHEAVLAFASGVEGPVDVVMNIAGVSTWGGVETLRHEDWRRMVDVNLMGPIHMIEAFLPEMVRAGRGGHLVNVSSAAGLIGLPWHAAYSASKFGLRGVSEVLRFDLRRHGIGVTLVCPGAVDTPLVQTVDIVGVDRDNPAIRNMTGRFRKHAASPEQVAGRILRGVERDRYLVFTSADIYAAHVLQRYVPFAYALVMRAINREFGRVVKKARA
jgi:NAD(P)-dependent dehydrogenase (short-subunit alcohol dehydrogenase family)